MCGRFTIVPTVSFYERFGLPPGPELTPRYNVAPGQEVPVIVRGDRNRVVPMTWGLVPVSGRGPGARKPVINARAETLLERPVFRDAVRKNRCLVPASGFYEWKREGTRKIPLYIRLTGVPLFAFAGLYSAPEDASGREHGTFTIVTTEPNRLVAGLHDRMPAILPRGKEETWIGAGEIGAADLTGILSPYPSGEMEGYPVSGKVNDPKNDGPDLIRPLPGLGD